MPVMGYGITYTGCPVLWCTSYKRRIFGYFILIHDNKQQFFLLIQSTKHYLYIYEENYLDVDLKVKPILRHGGLLEYKLTTDLTQVVVHILKRLIKRFWYQ